MYIKDSIWLAVSYTYVFFIIFLAEFIAGKKIYSKETLRKLVHIAVGTWIIPAAFLFDYWYIAIIPPATFVITSYIAYKKKLFKSIHRESKAGFGTIYFPVSFCLLIYLYWHREIRFVACVGLMSMAWGDGLAGILGLKFGKHKYNIGDTIKSIEGNLVMFLSSMAATVFVFLLFTEMNTARIMLFSILIALAATFVEAISVREMDNLTVPVISALVCYFLIML